MSRAPQVLSTLFIGGLSVWIAQYTLKPVFEQEQREKLEAQENIAREREQAEREAETERQRLEAESAGSIKTVAEKAQAVKSTYLKWVKVWEWGNN